MIRFEKPGVFFRALADSTRLKASLLWLSFGFVGVPAAALMTVGVPAQYVLPALLLLLVPFQYTVYCFVFGRTAATKVPHVSVRVSERAVADALSPELARHAMEALRPHLAFDVGIARSLVEADAIRRSLELSAVARSVIGVDSIGYGLSNVARSFFEADNLRHSLDFSAVVKSVMEADAIRQSLNVSSVARSLLEADKMRPWLDFSAAARSLAEASTMRYSVEFSAVARSLSASAWLDPSIAALSRSLMETAATHRALQFSALARGLIEAARPEQSLVELTRVLIDASRPIRIRTWRAEAAMSPAAYAAQSDVGTQAIQNFSLASAAQASPAIGAEPTAVQLHPFGELRRYPVRQRTVARKRYTRRLARAQLRYGVAA